MNGFSVGVGFGIYPIAEWEWEERNEKGKLVDDEDGDEVVFELHAALGWTFRISRAFAITPIFNVGNYFSDSPEAGAWAGLGLNLSFGF